METEIREGNVLIAKFMGAAKSKIDNDSRLLRFPEPIYNPDSESDYTYAFLPSELKYHSSWDWLMPVVEKIENKNFQFQICADFINISATNPSFMIRKKFKGVNIDMGIPETKIQGVWLAVIEFIKWYNENHNSQKQPA